ncbi:hypothetical protein LshimejAT787_2500380 [Lyophyllum shimeji]|uniref:Uncharacterized protein n=1 Tax=Lyophyllum shimeji TaxID=47721 RepID=A0A9P3Q2T7_LYOSH|nr:hypothetical protein LshimejAT787_2500380 [Lyophyllum shimeji]
MPPKKSKTKIPEIPWADNENLLTWALLTELEVDKNYKVIFGKKDKNENTSGETKVTVFKRIGEKILPELFAVDPTVIGDRVKSKVESTYRKHHRKLWQTGGGVRADGDDDEPSQEPSQEGALDFYIPPTGPDESTPAVAKNLWEQIEKEFPPFPRLHVILSTRPNVVPIVVTTALVPEGHSSVTWYQSPGDSSTEPRAHETLSQPTLPSQPTSPQPVLASQPALPTQPAVLTGASAMSPGAVLRTFGTPLINTPAIPTLPPQTRAPKPSTVSQESLEKARALIQKAPAKRSLGETLLDIQRENLEALRSKATEELAIKKRGQLIEELKLGIWSREEYIEKISELESPQKRQKRAYSPEWDMGRMDNDFNF